MIRISIHKINQDYNYEFKIIKKKFTQNYDYNGLIMANICWHKIPKSDFIQYQKSSFNMRDRQKKQSSCNSSKTNEVKNNSRY